MVATYSVGQLLWLRACAALLVLAPMMWRHRADFMQLERPWLQLLRVTLSTLEVLVPALIHFAPGACVAHFFTFASNGCSAYGSAGRSRTARSVQP